MSESNDASGSELERETFLAELKRKVDRAYENRARETWAPNMLVTEESLKRAEATKQQLEKGLLHRLLSVLTHRRTQNFNRPSQVSVSNISDYRALLSIAFNKLADEGHYERGWINEDIARIVEHESQHAIPLIGKRNQINYNIEFFEDPSKPDIGLRPSISLSGIIGRGLSKRVANATSEQSETDKILGD